MNVEGRFFCGSGDTVAFQFSFLLFLSGIFCSWFPTPVRVSASARERLVVRGLLFGAWLESRLSLGDVDLDAFGALGGGVLPFRNRSLGRHQSLSGLLTLLVGHRVAALLLPPRGFDLYRLLWCVGWSGPLLLLRTFIQQLKLACVKYYIY